jgi:predicted AAA+ superfamily ATPase
MTMDTTRVEAAETSPSVPRLLNLEELLRQKSHFLFGPRQTGKTFLARRMLKNARF